MLSGRKLRLRRCRYYTTFPPFDTILFYDLPQHTKSRTVAILLSITFLRLHSLCGSLYNTQPFCSRMFAYWLVSDVAMIAYAFFASS